MFIWIIRLSNKLNFAKLEFFKILKILEPVIYELDFSDSIKIIKIRYILVLELVDLEALLIKNILNINPKSQEKIWEIKKILNINLINNS